jgi:GNAT superfamily N-acetyltransferase
MTHLPLSYRIARHTDAFEVTEVCEMFHAESYQKFANFNFDQMNGWIEDRIDSNENKIFTAWDGDKLVGCLVGMTFCYPYSNTLVAADYIWYVIPKYRGGMIGVRLMKMFEGWAKGVGAVSITTGSTSGIKSERGAKLLQRLGYNPIGMVMEKELV